MKWHFLRHRAETVQTTVNLSRLCRCSLAGDCLPNPSHLTLWLGMNPFEFLDEPLQAQTKVCELSVNEDLVIVARVVQY